MFQTLIYFLLNLSLLLTNIERMIRINTINRANSCNNYSI